MDVSGMRMRMSIRIRISISYPIQVKHFSNNSSYEKYQQYFTKKLQDKQDLPVKQS